VDSRAEVAEEIRVLLFKKTHPIKVGSLGYLVHVNRRKPHPINVCGYGKLVQILLRKRGKQNDVVGTDGFKSQSAKTLSSGYEKLVQIALQERRK
jgi:hypothetical protein